MPASLASSSTRSRIATRRALRQSNAQVMMLQGGANDLNAEGARAITDVVTRLERMTRDAQGRGVAVILTTLTPQRPGSTKGTSPEVGA